jgi:hypothetical protein
MSSPDIAAGIMRREMEFLKKGLIKKVPNDGPADGQIYQVAQSDVATIGEKMAAEGIGWKPADKSKGSRKNGWQLIRDALANSKKGEGAGLYFTKRCKHAIGFIQDTPRSEEDPDDVDTEAEDHLQDELRYRMLDASRKVTQSFKTTHAK